MHENHKRKLSLTIIILGFLVILPFTTKSQLHGKYSIEIILNNGEILKPSAISLFDSTGRMILKKYCDSSGQCKFTGLNIGIYRVINRKYQIDTTFSMPMGKSSADETQFVMFIDFDRCNLGARQAKKEIRKGHVRLLLIGGIAPVYYFGQENFEKKFNAEYFDFGDSGSPAITCVKLYNDEVFAYLDRKYGNAWRHDVRRDVIGLSEYLKTHR